MTIKMLASILVALVVLAAVAAAQAPQRFDYLVRPDFFAGLGGDEVRLARAMELCEATLARNPRHAEALVWHGAGLLFRAGGAFQRGDQAAGGALWTRGMKEVDDAVALEPDNVGVRIPRATMLHAIARVATRRDVRPLLETAAADFERAYAIQQPAFAGMSVHARGELLSGLVDVWTRLGEPDRAAPYRQRIRAELAGTVYAGETTRVCAGCHVP